MGSQYSSEILASTLSITILLASLQGKKKIENTKGITNLGNSCYLNSLLQFLVASNSFVFYLEKLKESQTQNNSTLVSFLYASLKSLQQSKQINPELLLKIIFQVFNHTGMQQDAHELFVNITEALEKCESYNSNPMRGVMQSTLQCQVCQVSYHRYEHFYDISVNLKFNSLKENLNDFLAEEIVTQVICGKCSLDKTIEQCNQVYQPTYEALQSLKSKESIDYEEVKKVVKLLNKQNNYEAPFCEERRDMIKRMKISQMPQVLCIHFKRLLNFKDVNTQNVQFGEIESFNGTLYELKSVIEHEGTS